MKLPVSVLTLSLLVACASAPDPAPTTGPLPHYLCEQNVQFTARFLQNSVALDSNPGYELLFRKQSGKPGEYDNARMSVEFNLASGGKEAVLRYPLLPLALRCVRSN